MTVARCPIEGRRKEGRRERERGREVRGAVLSYSLRSSRGGEEGRNRSDTVVSLSRKILSSLRGGRVRMEGPEGENPGTASSRV